MVIVPEPLDGDKELLEPVVVEATEVPDLDVGEPEAVDPDEPPVDNVVDLAVPVVVVELPLGVAVGMTFVVPELTTVEIES